MSTFVFVTWNVGGNLTPAQALAINHAEYGSVMAALAHGVPSLLPGFFLHAEP